MNTGVARFLGRDCYSSVSHIALFTTVEDEDDDSLLAGETDGLAIDFTDTDDFALSTWAMQAVQERNSSVDTLQSPHVFFTQSGTSPKYVKNSATTIGWSPHNYGTRSQEFDNAAFTKEGLSVTANDTTAPDGTATADKLVLLAETNRHIAHLSGDPTGGANATGNTISVYVKYIDHQWILLVDGTVAAWFDVQNGVVGSASGDRAAISSVGNGWYRCSLSSFNTLSFPYVGAASADNVSGNFLGAGTSFYAWGFQVNKGQSPTAYIATTSAAKIGLPISYGEGLLVEPAATNLVVRSQEFATTWSAYTASVTSNTTVAPDGSTTADTLTGDTANDSHELEGFPTVSASTDYQFSVYAKAGNNNYIFLGIGVSGTEGGSYVFDLSDGSVGDSSSNGVTISNPSIVAVGDGWYRCAVTVNSTDTTPVFQMGLSNAKTGVVFTGWRGVQWSGANGKTVHFWGAQLELGTVATSYIPTVAATATRAADNIIAPVSQWNYDASNNSTYVDVIAREVATQHDFFAFDANNSNEDESIFFYTDTSANILMRIEDGGSAQLAPLDSGQNATANTRFQVAGSWATNDVDYSAEGQTAVTDGTATMPTITHMRLGSNPTPGNHLNGFIRRIVHVPRHIETADGDLETWRYNF
jgi:hypothetical protein